jgi:hypothetical protein
MKHPKKLVRDMVGKNHAPWYIGPDDKLFEHALQYPAHSRKGGKTKDYTDDD